MGFRRNDLLDCRGDAQSHSGDHSQDSEKFATVVRFLLWKFPESCRVFFTPLQLASAVFQRPFQELILKTAICRRIADDFACSSIPFRFQESVP